VVGPTGQTNAERLRTILFLSLIDRHSTDGLLTLKVHLPCKDAWFGK